VLELKKLSKLQHYGLLAMLGGLGAYLALVLLFPTFRSLWIAAWVLAFVGALTYFISTFPDAMRWLKNLGRDRPS
jgi:hypothetical protein